MKALLWNVGLPLALFAVFAIIDTGIRVWWRKRRNRATATPPRPEVYQCVACLREVPWPRAVIHYCEVHLAARLCSNCDCRAGVFRVGGRLNGR